MDLNLMPQRRWLPSNPNGKSWLVSSQTPQSTLFWQITPTNRKSLAISLYASEMIFFPWVSQMETNERTESHVLPLASLASFVVSFLPAYIHSSHLVS